RHRRRRRHRRGPQHRDLALRVRRDGGHPHRHRRPGVHRRVRLGHHQEEGAVAVPVLGTATGERIWRQRDRRQSLLSYLGWLVALIVLAVCVRFIAGQTLWFFVWDAPRQAV